MDVVIELNAEQISNLTEFQNLMLNMLGGLTWANLTPTEKEMCRKNGYDGDLEEPQE